jgi:geranylgeranyl pyrophosphate synthase
MTTPEMASLPRHLRSELAEMRALIDHRLTRLEEPLRSLLRGMLAQGKAIRPSLALLVGRLCGVAPGPRCTLAAALEMVHVATLVHDDLIDESPVRRRQPTLHAAWSVPGAVLAGDWLLGQSTSLVADLGQPRICQLFGQTLCHLCAGEIRQLLTTGIRSQPQDYYRAIDAKTASVFAAGARMAAILGGAPEPEVSALGRYGRRLGLAFQIVDDVLDLVGDERELGKPIGSDLRQGLVTLPTILFLETTGDPTPVLQVLSGRRDEEALSAAISAICASGAVETALVQAEAIAERARAALKTLSAGEPRRMLDDLTIATIARGRKLSSGSTPL